MVNFWLNPFLTHQCLKHDVYYTSSSGIVGNTNVFFKERRLWLFLLSSCSIINPFWKVYYIYQLVNCGNVELWFLKPVCSQYCISSEHIFHCKEHLHHCSCLFGVSFSDDPVIMRERTRPRWRTQSASLAFSPDRMMAIRTTRQNRLGSDFYPEDIDTEPEKGDGKYMKVLKESVSNSEVVIYKWKKQRHSRWGDEQKSHNKLKEIWQRALEGNGIKVNFVDFYLKKKNTTYSLNLMLAPVFWSKGIQTFALNCISISLIFYNWILFSEHFTELLLYLEQYILHTAYPECIAMGFLYHNSEKTCKCLYVISEYTFSSNYLYIYIIIIISQTGFYVMLVISKVI